MKSIKILCLLVVTTFSTVAFANQPIASNVDHKINGYKYLCMSEQGNKYDLEDQFNTFFSSIGFEVITPEEETELNETERQYVLYGTYETKTLESDYFSLSLTLRNKDGKIIFSSTKNSLIVFSLKAAINRTSSGIIQQIKKLEYSFDPTLIQESNKKRAEQKEEKMNN